MRKKSSLDRGKPLKFDAEGQEFATFLRSLEQFIGTEFLLFMQVSQIHSFAQI